MPTSSTARPSIPERAPLPDPVDVVSMPRSWHRVAVAWGALVVVLLAAQVVAMARIVDALERLTVVVNR